MLGVSAIQAKEGYQLTTDNPLLRAASQMLWLG